MIRTWVMVKGRCERCGIGKRVLAQDEADKRLQLECLSCGHILYGPVPKVEQRIEADAVYLGNCEDCDQEMWGYPVQLRQKRVCVPCGTERSRQASRVYRARLRALREARATG